MQDAVAGVDRLDQFEAGDVRTVRTAVGAQTKEVTEGVGAGAVLDDDLDAVRSDVVQAVAQLRPIEPVELVGGIEDFDLSDLTVPGRGHLTRATPDLVDGR